MVVCVCSCRNVADLPHSPSPLPRSLPLPCPCSAFMFYLRSLKRSDKPIHQEDYTYERHVAWMHSFLVATNLRRITLFCQDWGGLIGLRLVAMDPDRFSRVVTGNTFLPTGTSKPSAAFLRWRDFSQRTPELDIPFIIGSACTTTLTEGVGPPSGSLCRARPTPAVLTWEPRILAPPAPCARLAAFQGHPRVRGAVPERQVPGRRQDLPNARPDCAGQPVCRRERGGLGSPADLYAAVAEQYVCTFNSVAWIHMHTCSHLTRTPLRVALRTHLAFSDQDPITRGADKAIEAFVPGTQGQNHVTIKDAGHFLQEDKGVEIAHVIHKFIQDNPFAAIAAGSKL